MVLLSCLQISASALPNLGPSDARESAGTPNLLSKRAKTHSGHDDSLDALRPGTFTCFETGTTAQQSEITNTIPQPCNSSFGIAGDKNHFSFPDAGSQFPSEQTEEHNLAVITRTVVDGAWANVPITGSITLAYSANWQAVKHANTADCEFALQRVTDICYGTGSNEGSTFGGWWKYDDDGTSYGVDPAQSNGGNKGQ